MVVCFRAALGLLKDCRGLGTKKTQPAKPITAALDKAEEAAKVAEAEIAKAFGYELCKCGFPPTVMLTVGYTTEWQSGKGGPVFECPKCGYTTSEGGNYHRITPPRKT